MLAVPPEFLRVPYRGDRYPRAPGGSRLADGANCQEFAYALLRHFGRRIGDLRSSNLWNDCVYTKHVEQLEPLDLLLFNKAADPFGAHVSVYLGEGKAIHLAKKIGNPATWPLEEFQCHPEYAKYIGAKRTLG